jgi:hypothetical protein
MLNYLIKNGIDLNLKTFKIENSEPEFTDYNDLTALEIAKKIGNKEAENVLTSAKILIDVKKKKKVEESKIKYNIRNLIFQGGGVSGIGLIGSLKGIRKLTGDNEYLDKIVRGKYIFFFLYFFNCLHLISWRCFSRCNWCIVNWFRYPN